MQRAAESLMPGPLNTKRLQLPGMRQEQKGQSLLGYGRAQSLDSPIQSLRLILDKNPAKVISSRGDY